MFCLRSFQGRLACGAVSWHAKNQIHTLVFGSVRPVASIVRAGDTSPSMDPIRSGAVSRLHISPNYPFMLSWSMLEAMACCTPALGSATPPVREITRRGRNGYLFDFFNQEQLIEKALAALMLAEVQTDTIRRNARHEI